MHVKSTVASNCFHYSGFPLFLCFFLPIQYPHLPPTHTHFTLAHRDHIFFDKYCTLVCFWGALQFSGSKISCGSPAAQLPHQSISHPQKAFPHYPWRTVVALPYLDHGLAGNRHCPLGRKGETIIITIIHTPKLKCLVLMHPNHYAHFFWYPGVDEQYSTVVFVCPPPPP